MDVSSIAALASSMAHERTMNAVSITVLKKTLAVQAESALTLIAGVRPVTLAQNLPSHLGNNINVMV